MANQEKVRLNPQNLRIVARCGEGTPASPRSVIAVPRPIGRISITRREGIDNLAHFSQF